MEAMLLSIWAWISAHPELVVTGVLTVLGLWKGKPAVDAALQSRRARQIMAGAHVAFHAVEEAARLAPANEKMQGAAKLAAFLDKLDDYLEAHGGAPLAEEERGLAETMAGAINSASRLAGAAGGASLPGPR